MPVKKVVASKKSKLKSSGYGWVPDVPDQRDYLLSAVLRIPAKLPPKVDLRPLCSKVEDQGQLGAVAPPTLWPVRWNFWKGRMKLLLRISADCLFIIMKELLNTASNPIRGQCCEMVSRHWTNKAFVQRRNGLILSPNSRLSQLHLVIKMRPVIKLLPTAA